MRSTAELIAVLREHGWKVTPQRIAVFEALHACGSHPTAEEVYEIATERIGAISIRSVYQTLHELVDVGEVRAVHIVPGPTRFDPTSTHHDHLVCDICEAITDVVLGLPAASFDEIDDFRVDSTDVVLRGVCGRCRRTHVSG
jgi:Fur family transcriptional regulator, peroxide stress response regulator